MNIQQAKEIVAQKDGYNYFEDIRESLQEEYTRRAYELLISKLYTEEEVMGLCSELWSDYYHTNSQYPTFFDWFEQNKKKQ